MSCTKNLHQMAEYRISIYGRKKSEWDQMASWIVNNELYSDNVVWLIQVLLSIFRFRSFCTSQFLDLFLIIALCKTKLEHKFT
jgi:adenosine deaminase